MSAHPRPMTRREANAPRRSVTRLVSADPSTRPAAAKPMCQLNEAMLTAATNTAGPNGGPAVVPEHKEGLVCECASVPMLRRLGFVA